MAGPRQPREARALWFEAPRSASIRTEVVPECGPDDVVVQAIASGFGHGTELILYRGEGPKAQRMMPATCVGESMGSFPMKYGYQSVGRVVEAGPSSGLVEGDVVFARHPHQTCYTVDAVHENLVYRIPKSVENPEWAVFGNLLDVAVNALLDVPIKIGDVVVVFGLGVVGNFYAQLAARTTANVIAVDPIKARRDLITSLAGVRAVSPDDLDQVLAEVSRGRRADVVVEASGAPRALQAAISAAAFEGVVEVVSWYGDRAIPLSLSPEFHLNRLTMVSSQVHVVGAPLSAQWDVSRRMETVWSVLPSLSPGRLIERRFPFDEAPTAYKELDAAAGTILSAVLTYE